MMPEAHHYYTYILASRVGGTLYVGVSNDLRRRVLEHREGVASEFTRKHGVVRLVYYETHQDVTEAIRRKKRIKRWNRAWKIALIEENNPDWADLFEGLF